MQDLHTLYFDIIQLHFKEAILIFTITTLYIALSHTIIYYEISKFYNYHQPDRWKLSDGLNLHFFNYKWDWRLFHMPKKIFFPLNSFFISFVYFVRSVCIFLVDTQEPCIYILKIQVHIQSRCAKSWYNLFGTQLDMYRFFSFVFCL